MVTLCRVAAIVIALLASGDCRATPLRLGELVVSDAKLGLLWAIDPHSGNRRVFSSPDVGEGPAFSKPTDVVVSPEGDIYVLDSPARAIVHVDWRSGDRTVVSSDEVGTGVSFLGMLSLAIRDDYLYVGDVGHDEILEVDRTTGYRRSEAFLGTNSWPSAITFLPNGHLVFADSSREEIRSLTLGQGLGIREIAESRILANDSLYMPGATLDEPTTILVDPAGQYIYAKSSFSVGLRSSILRIDLSTGMQEIVSSEGIYATPRGEGPEFYAPQGLAFGPDQSIFVTNIARGLYQVSLETGDRKVFSANGVGEGPEIGEFYGVAVFVPEPASAILVSLAIVIVRSRRVRCNRTI